MVPHSSHVGHSRGAVQSEHGGNQESCGASLHKEEKEASG